MKTLKRSRLFSMSYRLLSLISSSDLIIFSLMSLHNHATYSQVLFFGHYLWNICSGQLELYLKVMPFACISRLQKLLFTTACVYAKSLFCQVLNDVACVVLCLVLQCLSCAWSVLVKPVNGSALLLFSQHPRLFVNHIDSFMVMSHQLCLHFKPQCFVLLFMNWWNYRHCFHWTHEQELQFDLNHRISSIFTVQGCSVFC